MLQRRGLIKGMNTGQKRGHREDREKKKALEVKRRGDKHAAAYIVCSADVCPCIQTRIHALAGHSCHAYAMSSHLGEAATLRLRAHLASRDRLLSQDHRTRHIPSSLHSFILSAHPFLHLFLPPHTKPCIEVVIAAGVEAAKTVEGGSVELVVVPHLEAEVAAGMPHSRFSAALPLKLMTCQHICRGPTRCYRLSPFQLC